MSKPVSSEQMLAFMERASTRELKLNSDGEPFYEVMPVLDGNSLAEALKALAQVIDLEHRFEFAREHAQCQQEQRLPGLGGMAN